MAFSQSYLEELIEEATVDCYDENEQYWGFYTAIEELFFPFDAVVLDDKVKVLGVSKKSSARRGILLNIEKRGKRYTFPLSELDVSKLADETGAWVEAYKLWSR